ncbi:hypothetical protein BG004_001119 [Podila humilis]|nr:hypothetical protein BG004_001119 [Podila humilis]
MTPPSIAFKGADCDDVPDQDLAAVSKLHFNLDTARRGTLAMVGFNVGAAIRSLQEETAPFINDESFKVSVKKICLMLTNPPQHPRQMGSDIAGQGHCRSALAGAAHYHLNVLPVSLWYCYQLAVYDKNGIPCFIRCMELLITLKFLDDLHVRQYVHTPPQRDPDHLLPPELRLQPTNISPSSRRSFSCAVKAKNQKGL